MLREWLNSVDLLGPRLFLPPGPWEVNDVVEAPSDPGVAPVPLRLELPLPAGQCSPVARLCQCSKDMDPHTPAWVPSPAPTNGQAPLAGTWTHNSLILFLLSSWWGWTFPCERYHGLQVHLVFVAGPMPLTQALAQTLGPGRQVSSPTHPPVQLEFSSKLYT